MREPVPMKVETFACAHCGGPLTIRSPHRTLVIACPSCGSLVDAKDPRHALIEEHRKRRHEPLIPLGQRGTLRGERLECLGMLRREIVVDGETYGWSELLLWSPFAGYRWLTEYDGHWTLVRPCLGLPVLAGGEAIHDGRRYKRFQGGEATVAVVLGEFYWQIRYGDKVRFCDHVSPPFILSSEGTRNETTWSIGEYVAPEEIREAFKLPRALPSRRGVAPAQPNPYAAHVRPLVRLLLIFLGAALLTALVARARAADERVHEAKLTFRTGEHEGARVSDLFELRGPSGNVEVVVDSGDDGTVPPTRPESPRWFESQWLFDVALVNTATGRSIEVGRCAGDRRTTARIDLVPAGRWYLRVERVAAPDVQDTRLVAVAVHRDRPASGWLFACAILLLSVPVAVVLLMYSSFENARWNESDHPGAWSWPTE